DQLGRRALRDWDVNVLDSAVDGGAEGSAVVEDATAEDASPVQSSLLELAGLHAKTVIVDRDDGQSEVITGSANLTEQAWSRNVEFDAVLVGPTRICGVDAVLGDGEIGISSRSADARTV